MTGPLGRERSNRPEIKFRPKPVNYRLEYLGKAFVGLPTFLHDDGLPAVALGTDRDRHKAIQLATTDAP